MSFARAMFDRIAAMAPLQMAQRMATDMRDEAALEAVIAMTMQSPTGQRALNWAIANNIKVRLGGRDLAVLGTYSPASGGVELNLGREPLTDRTHLLMAVDTLVHEIRHAWQDTHGLLPYMRGENIHYGRLDYALMQNALCEADAHVYGMTAVAEIELGGDVARTLPLSLRLEGMQAFFFDWFENRAQIYGEQLRKNHSHSMTGRTANPPAEPPSGINPYDRAQLHTLGRDFSGNANYIDGINRDVLMRKILNPHSVLRDYDDAAPVKGGNIRKAQMMNRLALRGGR